MTERSQTETWIVAAKRGDRLALAKLLATCDPRLRARAEARLDAALKAKRGPDDLLQEAYLEVVRRIDRFEGHSVGSFISWVQVILDHKLIDARRAAHCQARDIDREVPAATATDSDSYWNLFDHVYADSGTPSRVVRRQEALGALLASISGLSEAHRQVLQLRFLDGLAVADIAARLGKSEAAVVALSQRALRALRSAMDQLGEFSRGA